MNTETAVIGELASRPQWDDSNVDDLLAFNPEEAHPAPRREEKHGYITFYSEEFLGSPINRVNAHKADVVLLNQSYMAAALGNLKKNWVLPVLSPPSSARLNERLSPWGASIPWDLKLLRGSTTNVEGFDELAPTDRMARLSLVADWEVGSKNLQKKDRVAGVALDKGAQKILAVLNQQTSLQWSALPEYTGLDWSAICRGVALLMGAELCEAGSTTIRISEFGDRLLSESQDSQILSDA